MSPNSEDTRKKPEIYLTEDVVTKEKQRAPIYNPEDYALSLRKWGRRPAPNGPGLYSSNANITGPGAGNTHTLEADMVMTNRGQSHGGASFRDYRNPMLISTNSEMTLRQFSSVSELLSKLRNDLKLAYPSFVQEFVADPLDGITLLLDLLRAVQLSQSNNVTAGGTPGTNSVGKLPPAVQRKALLDELSCLQCLFCCCLRYSETVRKISASSAGLFTLAVCIMSNVNKSRIIALQLLTKACESMKNDNTPISEALSTLRLRFGEPVRFRFLVGMLTSAGGQGELLYSGLRFVNTFLSTSGNIQKRLYIQAELDQAGFDLASFKKNITINSQFAGQIFEEMDRWEKHHIDVETLTLRADDAERENDSLRDKVLLLERKVQILQEEKGILISLEQCLKERCSELQGEVVSLKSTKSAPRITNRNNKQRDDSTPAEDEGISSSERSITPEDYNAYNMQAETLPMQAKQESQTIKTEPTLLLDDDEEETTIEEVMEELRNIINDAETEAYQTEEKQKALEQIEMEKAQIKSKIMMRVDSNVCMENIFDNELEIIPCNLHPQPPRKTRSLVHLYVPAAEDYNYNKEVFFENETAYTSDDSSDSLLSASKYQLPRVEREVPVSMENNNRAILNTIMDARERAMINEKIRLKPIVSTKSVKRSESVRLLEESKLVSTSKLSEGKELTRSNSRYQAGDKPHDDFATPRHKSKSLDRIDDGLDSMVDIVMTGGKVEVKTGHANATLRPKSDSGNVTVVTTLSRSVSNVFGTVARKDGAASSYENTRMFLPRNKYEDRNETRYYFPRLQEKRSTTTSSSFLIKRGHTNAGMYSGQLQHQQHQLHSNVAKKIEYFATTGSKHSSSKVTDYPSGLY